MSQSEILDTARRKYDKDVIYGDVLEMLRPGNEFLQDVVDKFGRTRSQPHKARVACFFEMKSSDVGAIVGGQARRVRLRVGSLAKAVIDAETALRRERELGMPRSLRVDGEVLAVAKPIQHEQVRQPG